MRKYKSINELVGMYYILENMMDEDLDEIERTDVLMEMSEIEDILENTANKKYINHKKVREYMW